VRVDIPPRDSLAPPDEHAKGSRSGKTTPNVDEEEEEPTVPVTLNGPQPLVLEAQALLNQIISSKTSKTTQRVRDIPSHVLPFVAAHRTNFVASVDGADVALAINTPEREITVTGDREAVFRVVESIRATVEGFKSSLTSVKIGIPRRQHRLLVGKAVDEILAESNCSVVVPKPDDPTDEVTIWGQAAHVTTGLSAVIEKANSQYINVVSLPGPVGSDKQMLTYLARIGYVKTLSTTHPGVIIHMPNAATVGHALAVHIDVIGEKAAVESVIRQLSDLVGKLTGGTREVEVEWLIHRFVIGKNAKRCVYSNACDKPVLKFYISPKVETTARKSQRASIFPS
jgi:hypothetical protein